MKESSWIVGRIRGGLANSEISRNRTGSDALRVAINRFSHVLESIFDGLHTI